MLGHGRFQQVLDGTFCFNLSHELDGIRVDGNKRRNLMKRLELPVMDSGSRSTFSRTYDLVVVNGQVTAVIDLATNSDMSPAFLEDSLTEKILRLNGEVGFHRWGSGF